MSNQPPPPPNQPSPSPRDPYGTSPSGQPYGPPPTGDPYGAAPQQPSATPPSATPPSTLRPSDGPGFLKALFDLQFRHFITLKFASFIYILGIAIGALGWLAEIIGGIVAIAGHNGPGGLIGAVLLGWIPPLIWIIMFRLSIEFVIAIIRTSQNTSELVDRH